MSSPSILTYLQMLLKIKMIITTSAFLIPSQRSAFMTKLHAFNTPLESEVQNLISNIEVSSNNKAPSLFDFLSDEGNIQALSAQSSELKSQMNSAREKFIPRGDSPNFIQYITDDEKTSQLKNQLSEASANINVITKENASIIKDSVKDMSDQIIPAINNANSKISPFIKNTQESTSAVKETLKAAGNQITPALNNAGSKISPLLKNAQENVSSIKGSLKDVGNQVNPTLNDISSKISPFLQNTRNSFSNSLADSKIQINEWKAVIVRENVGAEFRGLIDKLDGKIDFAGVADKLHLNEYAAFYLSALVILIAGLQKNSEERKISAMEVKANEASEAAQVAAKGANVAKKLAKSIDAGANRKVKELEAEKTMMAAEISKLKAESSELKRVVKLLMSTTKSRASATSLTKKTFDASGKKPSGASIVKVATEMDAARFTKESVAENEMKETIKAARKVTAPKTATEFLQEEVKKSSPSVEKAAKELPITKTAAAKGKKTRTVAAKPSKTAADSKTTAKLNKNPWGSLKESTLKRRTIAQLREYLDDRKIDSTGMSKTEMVNTVQNLK